MRQISVTFTPVDDAIDGRYVHAHGLHGLLYHVLRQADGEAASWLHGHSAPKPYTLLPLFTEKGNLIGLRLTGLTKRTGDVLQSAWERAWETGEELRLGRQAFHVRHVECEPGPGFGGFGASPPVTTLTLHFLSPTAFRQGPGNLPLPLPYNVFHRPLAVWEAYAPPLLALSEEWLAWCSENVFVAEHQIETATIALDLEDSFTGFVGKATFTAHVDKGEDRTFFLAAWHALARLAAFCGVGRKTTMGMGAVELVES